MKRQQTLEYKLHCQKSILNETHTQNFGTKQSIKNGHEEEIIEHL